MASSARLFVLFLTLLAIFEVGFSSRVLAGSTAAAGGDNVMTLRFHDGALLHGEIAVNLIWYGEFTPTQRSIVADFINSIASASASEAPPTVATWWRNVENYYRIADPKKPSSLSLSLGKQILDEDYSLGKSLSEKQIIQLASAGERRNAINVVLTAADVTVDGFCLNRCGTHGYKNTLVSGKNYKFAYIWVGNSEAQCPGYCAWPFHQPIYGPQTPPLVAPNNDVGLDGIVMNLAALLAGTATNPFGNGFYQGTATAPLEAATACAGVYGKGAYPGYAGDLLVDPTTGASYNANGDAGRKYLLPAIYDPSTATCSTIVRSVQF